MIPSVFAGATAVYSEIGAEISNQTATAHKTEISAQARSKLEKGKKRFTWQVTWYESTNGWSLRAYEKLVVIKIDQTTI